MSTQYRVPCEECGKPEIDHLRMHSRVSPKYVKKKLNDDPRKPPESVSGTWVECNLCGNQGNTSHKHQEPDNEPYVLAHL